VLLCFCDYGSCSVVIVVANLKGGVGKTTSAVFLAEAAARRTGAALLVDSDPQGSAMRWADAAATDDGLGLRSVAVALPTPDLGRRLQGIAAGYGWVVIDTPPGHLGIVQAAARAANVMVVPCQPTLMDLDRVRATLDVASESGRPAAVLLTRARTNTRALAAAREALEEAELPVIEAIVPQREAIAGAYGARPTGPALDLYAEVLAELEAALT
jgi:chromosome partitioning protein